MVISEQEGEADEFERIRKEDEHVALGGYILPPDDGSFMQVVFMPSTPIRRPDKK